MRKRPFGRPWVIARIQPSKDCPLRRIITRLMRFCASPPINPVRRRSREHGANFGKASLMKPKRPFATRRVGCLFPPRGTTSASTGLLLEHQWELPSHIDQCVTKAQSVKYHEKYRVSLTAPPPSPSQRWPAPARALSLQTIQKLVEYKFDAGHDTGVQGWGQRKAAFGGALSAGSSSSSSGCSGKAMSTAAT